MDIFRTLERFSVLLGLLGRLLLFSNTHFTLRRL